MSMNAVTDVLCRTLEDQTFAQRVATQPTEALRGFDLTETERSAFTGASVDESMGKIPVGAFRLVSKHLNEVSPELRQRLNMALGRKASHGPAIPVTGN
jgi:hypothetical protein